MLLELMVFFGFIFIRNEAFIDPCNPAVCMFVNIPAYCCSEDDPKNVARPFNHPVSSFDGWIRKTRNIVANEDWDEETGSRHEEWN